MEKRKMAGYIRVENKEDLTTKENLFDDLLAKNNISINCIYEDSGFNDMAKNKPSFQKLIKDIEAGDIESVAISRISQISRLTIDCSEFEDVCERNDTKLIYLDGTETGLIKMLFKKDDNSEFMFYR